MSTFTDEYGDTLEITQGSDVVSFDANESGTETNLELSPEVAIKIGEETIRAARAILGEPEVATPASLVLDPGDEEGWNKEALKSAIQNQRGVTFDYVDTFGERTTRRVNPEAVSGKFDGTVLLDGFDLDRSNHRAFRLDRIEGKVRVNPSND